MSQLVESPTRHKASSLDLSLTSHLEHCQVVVDVPLESSKHCLARGAVPIKNGYRRTTASRRVCHYKSANRDGMRTCYSSYPWGPVCFSSDDTMCAAIVAKTQDLINLGRGTGY